MPLLRRGHCQRIRGDSDARARDQARREIRDFKPNTYYIPKVKLPDGVVLTWKRGIEGADYRAIDEKGRIIDRRSAEAMSRG